MLYALLITATLGADDFDTRDRWTELYKSSPLGRLICLPALWDDDPEVNYRARKITGVTLPEWAKDRESLVTAGHLAGCPYNAAEIEKLAVYYGDQKLNGGRAGYRIERVARQMGVVSQGCTMQWGTDSARRWIWWCRAKHAGLVDDSTSPCHPTRDFQVPIPPPREKK